MRGARDTRQRAGSTDRPVEPCCLQGEDEHDEAGEPRLPHRVGLGDFCSAIGTYLGEFRTFKARLVRVSVEHLSRAWAYTIEAVRIESWLSLRGANLTVT